MSKYLTLPEKRPEYRQSRQHNEFLTKLKHHYAEETAEQKENMFLRAVENSVVHLCNKEWAPHVSHLHYATMEEVQDLCDSYRKQSEKQILTGTEIVSHDKI